MSCSLVHCSSLLVLFGMTKYSYHYSRASGGCTQSLFITCSMMTISLHLFNKVTVSCIHLSMHFHLGFLNTNGWYTRQETLHAKWTTTTSIFRRAHDCFLHFISLTFHFMTFESQTISFHFIPLHLITFHFMTFESQTISFHFMFISHFLSFQNSFHFITYRYNTFHVISLQLLLSHFISYHFVTLHHNNTTFHCITLHPYSLHLIHAHFTTYILSHRIRVHYIIIAI